MKTKDFYDIFDGEIEKVLIRYKDDNYINKVKQVEQKKSYSLLIWFLEFYGKAPSVKNFITDGNKDASCDIIFENIISTGETVFYVIQSKWNNRNNCSGKMDAQQLKYTLNDFETVIRGDKTLSSNEKFNENYQKLLLHMRKNGKVEFIYLVLSEFNDDVQDNICSFNKLYGPIIKLEVYDIGKIRRDFIEFKYKGIKPQNPLEYKYNPEECKIKFPIERFEENQNRDFLQYKKPFKSYIFVVKPKTIYEIFDKFGFYLFFKNVRNPLERSNYNEEMAKTLKERPILFWYFNNGITAITKMIPDIGMQADEIEIVGLQIINGAQTVYTIYETYKNSSPIEQQIMDEDARITFRLIKSSDENISFDITKFTNSQNQIFDIDFMANDEIQKKLQDESFKTKVWYQRRRGEFVFEDNIVPESITVETNDNFALYYMVFYLQDPVTVTKEKKFFFISNKHNSKGLYEKIFNEDTNYTDMLASYYIVKFMLKLLNKADYPLAPVLLPAIALTKTILTEYLELKLCQFDDLSAYIIQAIEDEDKVKLNEFGKILVIAFKRIYSSNNKSLEDSDFESILKNILNSEVVFEKIRKTAKSNGLTKEEIQFIQNVENEIEAAATKEEK